MSPKLNLSFYRVILIGDLSNLDSFSVIAQFVSPFKYVVMTFSCLYIKYTICHICISSQHKLFPYRCITVLVIIDLDHSSFFRLYSDSLCDIPTDAKSKLENEVEKWDDWAMINEDADSRKLQYYHYIVDGNRDIEDSEDAYQEYVWKVDKIVSHRRRGKQTFLHVIFIRNNGDLVR